MLLFPPQSYQAVFPSGTRVRLAAVMDASHRAWTPAGKPLTAAQVPPAALSFRPNAAPNTRFFVVQVTSRRVPSVSFHIIGGVPHPADFLGAGGSGNWTAVGAANHGGRVADVRVGVADKAWKTVGTVAPSANGGLRRTGLGFLSMVRPNPAGGKPTVVAEVVLPVDPYTQAYRVVAFDRHGKPLTLLPPGNPAPAVPAQVSFSGTYESVGRVELQVRAYVWKTFKGVHL